MMMLFNDQTYDPLKPCLHINRFAQTVGVNYLKCGGRRDPLGHIGRKALNLMRQVLNWTGDPPVEHRIRDWTLIMPNSHNLPYYLQLAPDYMLNAERLVQIIRSKYAHATAIDIGANIGDTALSFQSAGPLPTLCIEPDPKFQDYLRLNTEHLGELVEIDTSMVGESPQAVAGRIENQKGTARLVVDDSTATTIQLRPLPDILKSHPRFEDARLLKIDTDGFDGRILRGHQAWLAAVKPVVFMEYCPDYARTADPDIFDTFASLQQAGYLGLVAYLNTGTYRETYLLTQADRLRHMHETFARPGCTAYLDLALFHTRDMDLYHQLVAWEKSGGNPRINEQKLAA